MIRELQVLKVQLVTLVLQVVQALQAQLVQAEEPAQPALLVRQVPAVELELLAQQVLPALEVVPAQPDLQALLESLARTVRTARLGGVGLQARREQTELSDQLGSRGRPASASGMRVLPGRRRSEWLLPTMSL